MKNGNWKLIELNPDYEEADNTFEHYFKDFGFYSVRTQWGEGNGYKLVSDLNGQTTKIFGRPYFSANGEYIISVSVDLEARYSDNGFQLFKNDNGHLEFLGQFEPSEWGPITAKCTSKNRLILKNETFDFNNNEMNNVNFFTELIIKNGG